MDEARVADLIAESLERYLNVRVIKDWGNSDDSAPQSAAGVWSFQGLVTVLEGIVALSNAMGGVPRFIENIGGVSVQQKEIPTPGRTCNHEVTYWTKGFEAWVVVHELAHVWDNRFDLKLSEGLEVYTGGRTDPVAREAILKDCDTELRLPGCNPAGYFYGDIPAKGSDRNFTRREDFAESVAAYVYPAAAEEFVRIHFSNPPYQERLFYADYRQTRRWEYVDGIIKGIINPLSSKSGTIGTVPCSIG